MTQLPDLALFFSPPTATRCPLTRLPNANVFDRKMHAQRQSDICSPPDSSLVFSTDTPLSPSEHPMPFFFFFFFSCKPLSPPYPTLSHSNAALFFFFSPSLLRAQLLSATRTTTELNSGFIKYAGKKKKKKKGNSEKAPTSQSTTLFHALLRTDLPV